VVAAQQLRYYARMSRNSAIWISTAIASAIGLLSYFISGQGSAGLGSAARNTARFSGLIFAFALAARSPRIPALSANAWRLFWAFIAAHGVHFIAVAAVVALDVTSPLHQLSTRVLITLAVGFGLVLATALTAGRRDSPFRSRVHAFFFYIVAASFVIAFGSRALHAPLSALPLALLLAALVLKLLPVGRESASVAASS
jgi:hypothetical protein